MGKFNDLARFVFKLGFVKNYCGRLLLRSVLFQRRKESLRSARAPNWANYQESTIPAMFYCPKHRTQTAEMSVHISLPSVTLTRVGLAVVISTTK